MMLLCSHFSRTPFLYLYDQQDSKGAYSLSKAPQRQALVSLLEPWSKLVNARRMTELGKLGHNLNIYVKYQYQK